VKYYDIDSDDAMERWKNKLYKILTRRCMCINNEVSEEEFGSYWFNGLDPMDVFISWMQHILKHHQVCALDTMLIGIHAQWWETHRDPPREWVVVEESMRERFRPDVDIHQYMCSCEW